MTKEKNDILGAWSSFSQEKTFFCQKNPNFFDEQWFRKWPHLKFFVRRRLIGKGRIQTATIIQRKKIREKNNHKRDAAKRSRFPQIADSNVPCEQIKTPSSILCLSQNCLGRVFLISLLCSTLPEIKYNCEMPPFCRIPSAPKPNLIETLSRLSGIRLQLMRTAQHSIKLADNEHLETFKDI